MDIAHVLDPRKELDLTEFTGSSTAGPSGQQPQIAPFYARMFDQEVVRRRQPATYEVHGITTARKGDAEPDVRPRKEAAASLYKADNGRWFVGYGSWNVGPFDDERETVDFVKNNTNKGQLQIDRSGRHPVPANSRTVTPHDFMSDVVDRRRGR